MRIRQLGSSLGASESRQNLTTFLINDTIAVDAGCLGLLSPVAAQRSVEHVLLSHSHIDHLATLPVFLDNVAQPSGEAPRLYASDSVWDCLTRDVFNERLWPDLSRIADAEDPFYIATELHSESPVTIGSVTITPVAVNHVVPTLGFLIEDDRTAVVMASDTAPTERIWELARRPSFRGKLRAVFLECSFPNEHEWLAAQSKHLCSHQFADEIAKLAPSDDVLIVAIHLKAALHDQISAELATLTLPNLMIGGGDQAWEF